MMDKITAISPEIVARWLFVALGVIWLLLGVGSLYRIYTGDSNLTGIDLIIVLLMFINSAVLFWIGWGIGKKIKYYFYLAFLVLAGNIILTITDQFGLLDLTTLIIDIGVLLLLLVTRSVYIADIK